VKLSSEIASAAARHRVDVAKLQLLDKQKTLIGGAPRRNVKICTFIMVECML
jgi:hypothetical protein